MACQYFKNPIAGSFDITSMSELFGSKTKCCIVSIGLDFKDKNKTDSSPN